MSNASNTREIEFEHDGNRLAGTLFLTGDDRPRAALAMLQGSGPTDRHNAGYFPAIREIILNAGVAVLAWDKPGIGASTGDWRRHTLRERANEAIEALRFLRRQPELASARLGLFGHSQGGWVAPIAAATAPDEVDFIIAQSGPGISPREQALYDMEHSMRLDGHNEDEVQRGVAYIRALQELADRDATWETVHREVIAVAWKEPYSEYLQVPDATMWNYFRRSWQEDPHPRDVLPKVHCPTLAIFGENDHLLPAGESAEDYRVAFTESGNADLTVRIFLRATHRIADPETGDFAEGYAELLGTWLRERAGHTSA